MELIIDGFAKSKTELVIGQISDFGGTRRAHLRIVVPSAEEEGEFIFTGKGIAIEVGRFHEICNALERVFEVAGSKKVVAKLPVGGNEIRVGVDTYKGTKSVYVRTFYSKDGDMLPSKKGVSVRVDMLEQLLELATKVQAEIERMG